MRTSPRRVQRLHVEDVDALHLAQDLEALEARGLLEVRWDGAGRGARREEVGLAFDLCVPARRSRSVSPAIDGDGRRGVVAFGEGGDVTFEGDHLRVGLAGFRVAGPGCMSWVELSGQWVGVLSGARGGKGRVAYGGRWWT